MTPVKVFLSYSHKDEQLRDALVEHLAGMQREHLISVWHDHRLAPGDEWRGQIDANLKVADVVLLLVSPSFMASDYCFDQELTLAMKRRADHGIAVIPIIVRPVDWSRAPFSGLQALPKDGRAVTEWADRDTALRHVATALRELIQARTTATVARSASPDRAAARAPAKIQWKGPLLIGVFMTLATNIFFRYATPYEPLETKDTAIVFALWLAVIMAAHWTRSGIRSRWTTPKKERTSRHTENASMGRGPLKR